MKPNQWATQFRQARRSVVEALDALARREGPMPDNRSGRVAVEATKHLIEAKRVLEEGLGEE